MSEHLSPISSEEAARLTAHQRGKFSWLNTKNCKLVVKAIEAKQKTVRLEGLLWSEYSIRYELPERVYLKPVGPRAPFTPCGWFSLKWLRGDNG